MKKQLIKIISLILIATGTLFVGTACLKNPSPHQHSYVESVVEPTCTEKGYTLHKCSCGDESRDNYVDEKGHDFVNYTSNNDATYEQDGTKTATCERLGC